MTSMRFQEPLCHLMHGGAGDHMGCLYDCHHAAFAAAACHQALVIRRFTVHRVQDIHIVLCELNVWCAVVLVSTFDWVEPSTISM